MGTWGETEGTALDERLGHGSRETARAELHTGVFSSWFGN